MKKGKKKIEFEKYTVKEKILISCLTGLTGSFILFLFGPIDIYANNIQEFAFTLKDFIIPVILVFAGVAMLIAAILMLFQRYLLNVASSFIFAFFISGTIDGIMNNKPVVVSGDVAKMTNAEYNRIIIVYAATFMILFFLSLILLRKWKNAVIFLCVLLVGMNGASLISDVISKDLIHDNDIHCDYVLSQKDLNTVSEKENIIYILFDRFDNKYYNQVIEKEPAFFDDLEGFTYFDSAVSVYTRTFPGVPYMVSGNDFTAQMSANDYLNTTYQNSEFLKDIKNNGYSINMYLDRYYEYTDAKAFNGMAENVQPVTAYKAHKKEITEYLCKLSLARFFKTNLAQLLYMNANNGLSSTLSTLECETGFYYDNDAWMSDYFKENKLETSGKDKSYTFIYMHGCHTPYILDENGDISENATDTTQVIGSFKTVKTYLQYLKDVGVYDNSTIIIAGDHGDPNGETSPLHEQIEEGVTTVVLIKPRNAKNKKIAVSHAEVSVADIIPTIVKDANLKTDKNYGESVFDIKENTTRTRVFYQSVYNINQHKLGLNKYEITGDAHDINNWKLTDEIRSDYQWY